MRLKLGIGLILLLVAWLSLSETAYAADHVTGIPNFHLDPPSATLHQFVLGSACYSLPSTELDLSCNPAFLSVEEKKQFRIDITFNEQVRTINEYRLRLESEDTVGIVDSILGRREPLLAKAAATLWYQHEWWAIGFTPFRMGLGSMVRNPAYPQASAHVYKEMEIFAKAGFLTSQDENLHFGVDLRYVDRDYFRKEFALLDVLADPSILRIETQKAVYLDPGITYDFDGAWASAVSATLTNVRVYQSGSSLPFTPVLDIGFMTSPPFFGSNRLRTTTHFTNHPDMPDLFSRFRWGATYEFPNVASISAMLGKSTAGIGINGHYDSVVLGAGYKTEELSPDQWQSIRISTLLLELGLVF